LWEKTEGRNGSLEPIEVVDIDTDGDGDETSSDEKEMPPDEAFSSLPTSVYVTSLKFADRKMLCAGKYGAPSDDALWRWCVRLAWHLLSVLPLYCLL
jgi:hypothetical protein